MHLASGHGRYDDAMTLADARAAFFADAGLGADGGYGARWVRVDARPVPFFFPNTSGRVAAAKLHDLHHVATGYATDWAGEAEIAAWEIAGGCGPYLWAWILNLGAFAVGMVRAPRRLFRAFVRGRRVHNLYHDGFAESALGEVTVGMLRDRLGRNEAPPDASRADVSAFLVWCAVAVLWHASLAALGLGLAWALWIVARR